jgi:hypothetical protein
VWKRFSQFKQVGHGCWICGSQTNLTREHKYKQSILEKKYGTKDLWVTTEGRRARKAQSANSDLLKFKSPICNECNSSRTQKADKAFDFFINKVNEIGSNGLALSLIWSLPEFKIGSESYVNLFRYFAKFLGNHFVDSYLLVRPKTEFKFPIPSRIISFILGKTGSRCVDIEITSVPSFSGEGNESTHFLARRPDFFPMGFSTTLISGVLNFKISFFFNTAEKLEIRYFHPLLFKNCVKEAKSASTNSIASIPSK